VRFRRERGGSTRAYAALSPPRRRRLWRHKRAGPGTVGRAAQRREWHSRAAQVRRPTRAAMNRAFRQRLSFFQNAESDCFKKQLAFVECAISLLFPSSRVVRESFLTATECPLNTKVIIIRNN
jgi:hypothetical protein